MSVKVVSFAGLEQQNDHHVNDNDKNNIQLVLETNDEQQKPTRPKIKRNPNAISYDDILNSLGFGVNNGNLYKKENQQINKINQINQGKPQYQTLDPRIKNSPIYNKYFKNYKDQNEQKQPEIILTPEQLRIQTIKKYIEVQEAKKRIAQIKSKKMF